MRNLMTKTQAQAECAKCHFFNSSVVNTVRDTEGITYRRRVCEECGHRWNTMQYPEINILKKKVAACSKAIPVPSLETLYGS